MKSRKVKLGLAISVLILEFSELLSYMMLNKQRGDDMTVTVLRNNQEMQLTVTLGQRPNNGQ